MLKQAGKKMRGRVCFLSVVCAGNVTLAAAAEGMLECRHKAGSKAFPLVDENKQAAVLCIDSEDAQVVQIAAGLLSEDIERVTGSKPGITGESGSGGKQVIIGTIGQSKHIDQLVADKTIDVSKIKGAWEAFLITKAGDSLVIAGSDRRGTAFGVFTLSKAIGVSPLYWWSEVVPAKQDQLHIIASNYSEGSPSVKYRGLFINDEAFSPGSLHDWASKTFEPEEGRVGPKTYARVFELLLRLKANYCWPAMHSPSKGFNINPKNAQVADDYAIVMGSSHCEQMLRNNVAEWKKKERGAWNYKTNRKKIVEYWRERLEANKDYENTYTMGMRGKHDSPMEGAETEEERVALTSQALKDQRELLAEIINPDLKQVPQVFCAYKEVLVTYQNGLVVPEEVTLLWPDDNHGYIRQLSTPEEQKRSGGAGVYYHLSLLGVPQQYLWLSTISPNQMSFELCRAHAYGADRIWVFNVGDIKPAEKELSFAMDLAWDIERWSPEKANSYARHWAAETFGKKLADDIGAVLEKHYLLAASGKPEHVFRLEYTEKELEQRLQEYKDLSVAAEAIGKRLPERLQDAYCHLVLYPIQGSRYLNEYWLIGRRSMLNAAKGDEAAARKDIALSKRTTEELDKIDVCYNGAGNGKWEHMIVWRNRFRRKHCPHATEEMIEDCRKASESATLRLQDANVTGDVMQSQDSLYGRGKGGTTTFRWEAEKAGVNSIWVRTTIPTNRNLKRGSKEKRVPAELSGTFNGKDWVRKGLKNAGGAANTTVSAPLWHNVVTVDVKEGWNELTLNLSTPYIDISDIRVSTIKPFPAEHLQTVSAGDFVKKGQGSHSAISKFAGPGTGWGVASMPFTAPSLSEEQIGDAPWVDYKVKMPAGASRLQIRTIPNLPIHEGRGVRYAVSVDGAAPEVFDVQSEEFAAEWQHNVIHGYTSRFVDYENPKEKTVQVRIYLLDPGLVLRELMVDPAR
jgi:hypothetical protein